MKKGAVSRALPGVESGVPRYEQAPVTMSAEGPFLLNVAWPTTDWTQ
jgi:hypothetical protein